MLLGCIGDDFTGSSDLANTLYKQGMRTVQYSGVPTSDAASDVEAGVVALKSRSIPVADAVAQSLDTYEWLKAQGCRQFFFKYCSTFDSTPEGNIGPVADALADALGADSVIVCPAFPGAGRTLYQGHLFVNGVLLNECGMQDHPLTPMTDADIRRWLAPQTSSSVGHIAAETVVQGPDAVRASLASETQAGHRLIVVDAIHDLDLMTIGAAASDLKLITGGSGVALGLPRNFRDAGLIGDETPSWRGESGPCAVLSGSCSRATRGQIEEHVKDHPIFEVIAADVIEGRLTAEALCGWVMDHTDRLPLVYSSADPDTVAAVQEVYGREAASEALEGFFADLSRHLVDAGIKRLIVAGGETSGAVVEGLDVAALDIGPEIDPGVPAMRATDKLVIALKSGNFGAPDFFTKAADMLAAGAS